MTAGSRAMKPKVAIIGSSSSCVMIGLKVLVNQTANLRMDSLRQSSIMDGGGAPAGQSEEESENRKGQGKGKKRERF